MSTSRPQLVRRDAFRTVHRLAQCLDAGKGDELQVDRQPERLRDVTELIEAFGGEDAIVRPDARDDVLRPELRADLELWNGLLRVGAVGDARELDVVHAQSGRGECGLGLAQQLRIRREIEVGLAGQPHVDRAETHEVVTRASGDVGHLRRRDSRTPSGTRARIAGEPRAGCCSATAPASPATRPSQPSRRASPPPSETPAVLVRSWPSEPSHFPGPIMRR